MQTRLELYERVTPLAGLGIFERNLETGDVYWNTIVGGIFEVGQDFDHGLPALIKFFKNPEAVQTLIAKATESGMPETETLEILTAKNNSKCVKINIQAELNDGLCKRVYGTIEDVTHYVKMIGLLKEREKRFIDAFDFAPIGMAIVSLDGDWIKVNQSLCKMLGYSEGEFLLHTFQDFTHPDDLDTDLGHLHQLLEGKIETYSIEKRYFHKDRSVIWVILNVTVVRNEDSKPLYFVSQIRDITERKRTAETILNQNNRLLNFAHIVSHNLRTHTGNLKMLTTMLLEEKDETERIQLMKMLNENSGNLLETLDHLNDVVKAHDETDLELTDVNLKDAVQRVLDILSASIIQTHAEIIELIPGDAAISVNPAYLESIIMNLVSNSLKYKHPERPPRIRISCETTATTLVMHIQDNGVGIDLNAHGDRLFGMYNTFHEHPESRGIGLFLVKNQIEAMGGSIQVQSSPGQGTTFTVAFNVEPEPANAVR